MYSAPQIELVANSLLPKFIPKDESLTEFSFQFTLAPNNTYKVYFEKTSKKAPIWTYVKFEEILEK
ncbi:MAG: hypothetical protein JWQ25_2895 [Daejeonella sp.]|nr:hypothetical protein [Daejeonella sp.]